ncbi:unnamed protein product [Nesidiocoris tenuis]|uniref:Uncharacterized protein n=2 Tax=Nesidiocoris tenuis TaxID=355587 RepID=A0A6H5GRE9_9HEMI|nr:unnamed protein product [Nesidiocoris tenuis]
MQREEEKACDLNKTYTGQATGTLIDWNCSLGTEINECHTLLTSTAALTFLGTGRTYQLLDKFNTHPDQAELLRTVVQYLSHDSTIRVNLMWSWSWSSMPWFHEYNKLFSQTNEKFFGCWRIVRPSVGLYIHGGTCPILQASRHQWQAGRPTQHSTGTFLAVVCELYRTAFSSTFGTLTDFYSGIISSALSTEPVKCANLALENNFLFSLNYPLISCGALRSSIALTEYFNRMCQFERLKSGHLTNVVASVLRLDVPDLEVVAVNETKPFVRAHFDTTRRQNGDPSFPRQEEVTCPPHKRSICSQPQL